MNALDSLIDIYREHGDDKWSEDLWLYSRLGIVHLSDDFCIMARPVHKDWDEHDIINAKLSDLTADHNMWHIHVATGTLSRILAIMPYPLPWASFQRNGGKLKYYNLNKILNHELFQTTQATSTSRASRAD